MVTVTQRAKVQSQADVLQRYPRLTGHLICASLGYFTPEGAAGAILHHVERRTYYWEW